MAIQKTCKVSVYVMANKINQVIEYLQKASLMEMTEGAKSLPESAIKGVSREIDDISAAIAECRKIKGGRGFLKRQRRLKNEINQIDERHILAAREMAREILRCAKRTEENREKIEGIDERIRQCSRFLDFDGKDFSNETEFTKCEILSGIPQREEQFLEEIKKVPFFYKEISRTKSELIIFCAYLKRDREKAEEILKKYGFASPDFSLKGKTPKEEINWLKSERERLDKEIKIQKEQIIKLSKGLSGMELLYDVLTLKKERYSAFLSSETTEKVFVLTGYVLRSRLEEFKECITGMGAVFEEILPEDGEVLPVAFSNNSFASPVEEVTASYSMPGEGDIDPNPIMAVFYYWFFGMMFSDAGYGLLMMAVCGALGFLDILKRSRRSIFKMFFWCGLSTTLWGIAYGSFFGDLIGTVSKVFGNGNTEFSPVLIDPVNQALELLIISVAFGLVHILTALLIKFRLIWKTGDKSRAVYDVGSWILVLSGGAVFAVGAATGASIIKKAGIFGMILGAGILVIMSGRDKKSPIKRFFSGILSLYDVTGYVGDILSYSRLMALGLATGVIASVVNVLASLGGNSPLGVAVFILVSVFGHTLNFAINMLGAYVHTNRLQYVEFYQKFYAGGGKRFRPLSMDTEYYDFSGR